MKKGFAFVLLNEGERREFDVSSSSSFSSSSNDDDDIECRLSVCLRGRPLSLSLSLSPPLNVKRDELYVVGKAASQSRKKLAEFAKEREREGRKEGVLYGDHSSN